MLSKIGRHYEKYFKEPTSNCREPADLGRLGKYVDYMHTDDSVSVAASHISSRSSSVRSSTYSLKMVIMQSKLNSLKVTQELERSNIEAELTSKEFSTEIERVRMEGELLAISEKERVLVEFETLGHVTSVTNVIDYSRDKPISGDMLHDGTIVQQQVPCVVSGAECVFT